MEVFNLLGLKKSILQQSSDVGKPVKCDLSTPLALQKSQTSEPPIPVVFQKFQINDAVVIGQLLKLPFPKEILIKIVGHMEVPYLYNFLITCKGLLPFFEWLLNDAATAKIGTPHHLIDKPLLSARDLFNQENWDVKTRLPCARYFTSWGEDLKNRRFGPKIVEQIETKKITINEAYRKQRKLTDELWMHKMYRSGSFLPQSNLSKYEQILLHCLLDEGLPLSSLKDLSNSALHWVINALGLKIVQDYFYSKKITFTQILYIVNKSTDATGNKIFQIKDALSVPAVSGYIEKGKLSVSQLIEILELGETLLRKFTYNLNSDLELEKFLEKNELSMDDFIELMKYENKNQDFQGFIKLHFVKLHSNIRANLDKNSLTTKQILKLYIHNRKCTIGNHKDLASFVSNNSNIQQQIRSGVVSIERLSNLSDKTIESRSKINNFSLLINGKVDKFE